MRPATKNKKAYARAGVDVDLGNRLKSRIQSIVQSTHGPEVLKKIGGFGGHDGYNGVFHHTTQDTLDKLSTKSLGISGSVILETVRILDKMDPLPPK